MLDELTVGEELTFDIYGTTVKGKFISCDEEGSITIETTQDFVCEVGEEQNINKQFLVRN